MAHGIALGGDEKWSGQEKELSPEEGLVAAAVRRRLGDEGRKGSPRRGRTNLSFIMSVSF